MSTVVESAVERERKYLADGVKELPDLSGLPGIVEISPVVRHELGATYFDTADLRLLAAGITLRRRTGGTDEGWHLKLPLGVDARTERRVPLGEYADPPPELVGVIRGLIRHDPLAPVATIDTLRDTRQLLGQDGTLLGEIEIDHVTARRLPGDSPVEWAEIEVEWTAADSRLADGLDKVLHRAGIRRSPLPNKLSKVLTPQVVAEHTAGKDLSRSLGEHLRRQVDAIVAADIDFRCGGVESVHNLRVAARSARSVLQCFQGYCDHGKDVRRLITDLRWLGNELGVARDAEVQRQRLLDALGQLEPRVIKGPVARRISAHFDGIGAREADRALAALNSDRYLDLLDGLASSEHLLHGVSVREASVIVGELCHDIDRSVRKAMHASGSEQETSAHRARKLAKRLRYLLDALDATHSGTKDARQQLAALQNLLGDYHETVVARSHLQLLDKDAFFASEDAFTYGALYMAQGHAGAAALAHLSADWAVAERAVQRHFR